MKRKSTKKKSADIGKYYFAGKSIEWFVRIVEKMARLDIETDSEDDRIIDDKIKKLVIEARDCVRCKQYKRDIIPKRQ